MLRKPRFTTFCRYKWPVWGLSSGFPQLCILLLIVCPVKIFWYYWIENCFCILSIISSQKSQSYIYWNKNSSNWPRCLDRWHCKLYKWEFAVPPVMVMSIWRSSCFSAWRLWISPIYHIQWVLLHNVIYCLVYHYVLLLLGIAISASNCPGTLN